MKLEKLDYVLLAAGRGKRLWPITERTPKAMVRIMGKPIIEWLVEGVARHANRIIIVVGKDGDEISTHFERKPYGKKLLFVRQEKQLGTGHALLQAEHTVGGDFIVMNADTFWDPSIFSLLRGEARPGIYFAVAKRVQDASKYGVFKAMKGKAIDLVEKPKNAGAGLVNTGIFHLPKRFFLYLKSLKRSLRGEYELTDAVREFARKERLAMVEFHDYWNDAGYFWNYLDANAFALEKLMKKRVLGKLEKGVTVKGNIFVGKGALVKAGTYIEGPVWIGENCVIGPRAYLRPGTVVENGCHVGNSTEVKNSIIMRGSAAAHLSYIGDSIICEDANLGGGTILANLRFDDAPVRLTLGEQKIASGKRKLGCVIGHGTKIGANVVVNPGMLIGSWCRVYPGAVVSQSLDSKTTLKE